MCQGHTQTHTIANQQTENTDDCNTLSEKISLHGTLYKPPNNNHNLEILRKLFIVSFIAFIFLVAEIVGGVISGSLAILSDAAHMFSDLSGFFISIVAVWISSKPASKSLSFGYHRSEVIGALISIILIWVVTVILLYEATVRIINKEPVEQPVYMLATAVFGLICNLIMAKVLHSGPGHHHGCSHGHSHGDGHNHNHSHDHNHDHGDKNHSHNHKHNHGDNHKHEQNHKKSHCSGHQHEHKVHDHKEYDNMKALKQIDHKHDNNCQHDHQNNENQQNDIENQKNDHSHNHEQHNMKESCQQNNQDHNHNHDECKSNSDQPEQQQQKNNEIANAVVAHQHSEKCDHDHNHDHNHEHDHNHDHDHNHNHDSQSDKKKNISQVEAKDNYNLRAAMIHVLGDLLQSIGVLIAAFLIYFLGGDDGFNYWHLADPICTYIFSILVLLTTKNVSIDCFKVLMEGTPSQIDVQNFKEKLQKIANVMEIHDLHIWQLSQGKPSLTCHIFISENPREVLNKTTQLCREYGIYHSTIQIEEWIMKDSPHYIKCDHNIHY
ncbi:hypothetical protein ABPG74_021966 [Tetrahymena malaccensis]